MVTSGLLVFSPMTIDDWETEISATLAAVNCVVFVALEEMPLTALPAPVTTE